MARGDLTIKIYRRLAKTRYLKGKHVYEHERICVPIPSRLHDTIKPFLNQRLNISLATQNSDLQITLHPAKTFLHAETPPNKLAPKYNPEAQFKHENATWP